MSERADERRPSGRAAPPVDDDGARETVAVADVRREQMLQAAVAIIEERGFPDTRITDVAARAEVSPALVIYYFKTKDNLLAEALRYAEDLFYAAGERETAGLDKARDRLETVIRMSCLPDEGSAESVDSWVLYLDLWAQAVRHPEIARVREESDRRWRSTVAEIVREGQRAGEFAPVDADDFAVLLGSLTDGVAVQIALHDTEITGERAFDLCMRLAGGALGFDHTPGPARQSASGAGTKAGASRARGGSSKAKGASTAARDGSNAGRRTSGRRRAAR
jgi:AcrR family transcriptional regulator